MPTLKQSFHRLVLTSLLFGLIVSLFYPLMAALREGLTVHAQSPFTFAPDLSGHRIQIPYPTGFIAPGQEAYKNERLQAYQGMLKARGITDERDLKLLAAQLLVENGAISEDVDGDGGCSIGIPQRNVCLYGYTAKSFRKKFPNWKDWRTQMEWMADAMASHYFRYNGQVKCAIIHHNRPASAVNGCRDTAAGYYGKVVKMSSILSDL